MAAADPSQSEPYTFDRAMYLQGLEHVIGTAWDMPATRPKIGGNDHLVKTNEQAQYKIYCPPCKLKNIHK